MHPRLRFLPVTMKETDALLGDLEPFGDDFLKVLDGFVAVDSELELTASGRGDAEGDVRVRAEGAATPRR